LYVIADQVPQKLVQQLLWCFIGSSPVYARVRTHTRVRARAHTHTHTHTQSRIWQKMLVPLKH